MTGVQVKVFYKNKKYQYVEKTFRVEGEDTSPQLQVGNYPADFLEVSVREFAGGYNIEIRGHSELVVRPLAGNVIIVEVE